MRWQRIEEEPARRPWASEAAEARSVGGGCQDGGAARTRRGEHEWRLGGRRGGDRWRRVGEAGAAGLRVAAGAVDAAWRLRGHQGASTRGGGRWSGPRRRHARRPWRLGFGAVTRGEGGQGLQRVMGVAA